MLSLDIPGLTNLDISGATPDTKKRDILGPKWTYLDSVFRICLNCDTWKQEFATHKKFHNAHHKLFSLQTCITRQAAMTWTQGRKYMTAS